MLLNLAAHPTLARLDVVSCILVFLAQYVCNKEIFLLESQGLEIFKGDKPTNQPLVQTFLPVAPC